MPAQHRLFTVCGLTPGCLHRLTLDGLALKAGARSDRRRPLPGRSVQRADAVQRVFAGVRELPPELRAALQRARRDAAGLAQDHGHGAARFVAEDSGAHGLRDRSAATCRRRWCRRSRIPLRLRTLSDLVFAYERGAYDAVVLNLRSAPDPARLIDDFDKGEQPVAGLAPPRGRVRARTRGSRHLFATPASSRQRRCLAATVRAACAPIRSSPIRSNAPGSSARSRCCRARFGPMRFSRLSIARWRDFRMSRGFCWRARSSRTSAGRSRELSRRSRGRHERRPRTTTRRRSSRSTQPRPRSPRRAPRR